MPGKKKHCIHLYQPRQLSPYVGPPGASRLLVAKAKQINAKRGSARQFARLFQSVSTIASERYRVGQCRPRRSSQDGSGARLSSIIAACHEAPHTQGAGKFSIVCSSE